MISHQHILATNYNIMPQAILDHLGIVNPTTIETVYDPMSGWRIAVVNAEGNHLIICDETLSIVTVYR